MPIKIYILILSLLICFTAFSKIQPKAEKGILNLTKWNFKKDGIVNLSGEWKFYWNKLIQPEHFHLLPQKMTGYIKMPSYWINQTINGQTFPSYGCATYRLIMFTKHYEDAEFSAHLKEMFSDGIVDQFGGDEDGKFGFEKLETLIKYMSAENMCTQHNILLQTIEKWKGTNKQTDDMLIIGLKINAIS